MLRLGRPTRSASTSARSCGIDPVGITATDDVDALLAPGPRRRALQPDVAEHRRGRAACRRAGVDVIRLRRRSSTARGTPADRARIEAAVRGRGRRRCSAPASRPGWIELMGIGATNLCDPSTSAVIDEASDTTLYDSPATELPCGFGRRMDDPELPGMSRRGHRRLRRGRGDDGRRPRGRARRHRVRVRVRRGHRGRRHGLVDDRAGAASPASGPAGRAESASAP